MTSEVVAEERIFGLRAGRANPLPAPTPLDSLPPKSTTVTRSGVERPTKNREVDTGETPEAEEAVEFGPASNNWLLPRIVVLALAVLVSISIVLQFVILPG